MKIRGAYLLSRRSIVRMIAAMTAALVTLYSTAMAEGEALVRRIHNATIALVTLDSQMLGRADRAVVPDALYLESKSLYLMARRPHAAAAQPMVPAPARGAVKRHSRRSRPGGLSQEDVARAFGVTRQTVVRWERMQTADDPGNASNPWGYYRSLRTNPELRGSFEMLANQAKSYLAAKDLATSRGGRFRMTFVRFREEWFKHNAAARM